jgi:hypothetical protein
MATTVARLEAVLSAQTRDFDRAMDRSQSKMRTAGRAAGIAGAAIFAGLGVMAKRGFDEISESQKVMAQTTAGIKSTGGAANVTAVGITNLSNRLSHMSGVDDELIQQGANLLLTFRKVHNEVGRGNNIFDRATQSALDLSVRGFGSMDSTSKMLGKALEDPIRGMTALRRAGVTFTESQKKTITAMVESGNLLGAQKMILAEVEAQVGGSAKAYGETLPGQMAKARNSFDEMSAQLVTALLPAMTALLEKVAAAVTWLSEHETIAKALAIGLGVLAGALVAAAVAQALLNLALFANPIGLVVLALVALGAALVVAYNKSETFRNIVNSAFTVVKTAANILKVYLEHTWIPAFKLVFSAAETAAGLVKTLFGWFRDNSSAIWNGVKDAVNVPLGLMEAAFNTARAMIDRVQNLFVWFQNSGGAAITAVKEAAAEPLEALRKAFDKIRDILVAIKEAVQWLINNVKKIPDFDLPGIGNKPNEYAPPPSGGGGDSRFTPKIWDEMAIAKGMGGTIGASSSGRSYGDHGKRPSHAIDVFGSQSLMSTFANMMYGRAGSKDVFYGYHSNWQDNGRMVSGWGGNENIRDTHKNHVHYSVFDKGGWLKPGLTLAANYTGRPERVGGGNTYVFNFPQLVATSKQELISLLKNAIAQDKRSGGLGFA